MERKQRVQEKIAEFRFIRFQNAAEKMKKEQEDAENERIRLIKLTDRRNRYMDAQKAKL